MKKIVLRPTPQEVPEHHGIGRVVHAQYRYLPDLGYSFVENEDQADLVVTHTQNYNYHRLDVVHLHGAYWTGDVKSGEYNKWHATANKAILHAIRQARHVTVPSAWVGEFIRRDFLREPEVIGHGIDLAEWGPGETEKFIFWAKNRKADVCDPTPAYGLAEKGLPVISTFGPSNVPGLSNFYITRELPPDQLKEFMQRAGVYLATTLETFGITTLEALACGVPVLGYRWGGTADIIQHKVHGYLVEPGDTEGLVEGYHELIEHRAEYSERCLERAKDFTWDKVLQNYAALYETAHTDRATATSNVSVVIANYNYGDYVGRAVGSALAQSVPVEVVVVDDGSTDGSRAVLAKLDKRVRVIHQANRGVAAARNRGIQAATGDLIVSLDADDALHPEYVRTLQKAMTEDASLGVAYTGLNLVRDGEERPNAWPPAFDWEVMTNPTIPPASCIPSAAMFRKEMWRRAGGYRQAYAPAEDTEFWVRGLSTGFEAKKVTDEGLFLYTVHGQAKKYDQRIDYWYPWMRDKLYPSSAPSKDPAPIRSYVQPLIALRINLKSAREERFLPAMLESLRGQTFRNWEVVAPVLFTPAAILKRFPFLHREHTAPIVIDLPPGRILLPEALQEFINAWAAQPKAQFEEVVKTVLGPYSKVSKGAKPMGCCGGSASQTAIDAVQRAQRMGEPVAMTITTPSDNSQVRMSFVGDERGSMTFGGPSASPSGRSYRGGNNAFDKYINADPKDVEWLKSTGKFVVVPPPQVAPPAPQPAATVAEAIRDLADLTEAEDEPVDSADPNSVSDVPAGDPAHAGGGSLPHRRKNKKPVPQE